MTGPPPDPPPSGDPGQPHIVLDTSFESKASATGSAMAHVLARPDSIRLRAQNAATTSSAVAAALVVAAVVGLSRDDGESWSGPTIVAVALAVVSWIVAVWMFVRVVTHGTADLPRDQDYQALVNAYESHSGRLRKRLRRAALASGVALVVTAAALAFEIGERLHAKDKHRQLVLGASHAAAISTLCGWEPAADSRIDVRVSTDELSRTVVKVHVLSRPLEPGSRARWEDCMAPRREMRLPRGAILAVNDLED